MKQPRLAWVVGGRKLRLVAHIQWMMESGSSTAKKRGLAATEEIFLRAKKAK